jgi:hypothetical protein
MPSRTTAQWGATTEDRYRPMRLFFNQTSPYARKVRVAIHESRLNDGIQFLKVALRPKSNNSTDIKPLFEVATRVLANSTLVIGRATIVRPSMIATRPC